MNQQGKDKVKGNQRGSVLVFSLIVLSLTLVSALGIASVTAKNRESAIATARSTAAFQIADSAMEMVLQRIYRVEDVAPGTIANYTALASGIGASCSNGYITGNYSPGTYRISFWDNATPAQRLADCSDTDWRADSISVRSEGTAFGTTRVVELGILPPP